jgi:putative tryptophan/tyrosine transport system substrate-binding protein
MPGSADADWFALQPAKFDLVINLKTAKDLGITIPNAFHMEATELIE